MSASQTRRKAIFITGAASGIGLACARRFAAEGWFVGLADIDLSGLKAALALIGPDNGCIHRMDVRDREAWTASLHGFSAATGSRMDVLLNNAGVARFGALEELSDQDVDQQVDINLKGVINGVRIGLPLLKATPGSRLINVASCAGLYGSPKLAVYSATKFAVRGLSEALDIELAAQGVAVSCVLPWFIDTPILNAAAARSNVTLNDALRGGSLPVYSVEEAAEVVWRAAHGSDLHYFVGRRARQMNTVTRLMPSRVRKWLRSRPTLSA